MKITGGSFKSRDIAQPSAETTRPMTGKATEAIFNMLGDMGGLSVLDLYAGSGVLGIESVSRGAGSVIAVERDRQAARVIQDNYDRLGISEVVQIETQPVPLWLATNTMTFDIVFTDPPFAEFDETAFIEASKKAGNVYVVRHGKGQTLPSVPGMDLRRHRQYGNSLLALYTPQN
jgi:16S rRNA (guanine966-N2)-methyltransferase